MSATYGRCTKIQTNCCSQLSRRQCMLDLQSVATFHWFAVHEKNLNLIGDNLRLASLILQPMHGKPDREQPGIRPLLHGAAAEGAFKAAQPAASKLAGRMRPPSNPLTSREGCTLVCTRSQTHTAACLAHYCTPNTHTAARQTQTLLRAKHTHSMQPLLGCVLLSSGASGEAALKLCGGDDSLQTTKGSRVQVEPLMVW